MVNHSMRDSPLLGGLNGQPTPDVGVMGGGCYGVCGNLGRLSAGILTEQ